MALVKFLRGLEKNYVQATYKDGIYFATDTGHIYLNGVLYGGDSEVKVSDVKVEDSVITVTYTDGSIKTFQLVDLIAEATEQSAGLMSAADKETVTEISSGLASGNALLSPEQARIISDVKNGTYDNLVEGVGEDKILSLTDKVLSATVSLSYDEDNKKIVLLGKDNQIISTIDAKRFVKDGMLNTVELLVNPDDQAAGTYLVFTWNTEAGVSDPMYVPVTDLIDVYTSGDGIEIKDKVITAKVKTVDPYIEVTTEGIASKGIDNAILIAKNAVIGVTGDTKDADTIYGAKAYASGLVAEVNETLKSYTVKSVDPTAVAGISVVNTDGVVKVNVDTDELTTALVGGVGETGPVSGATIKLGKSIVDGDEEIIAAGSSVQAAIQSLSGQIQSAVAGGITGISGDEYISVTGGNAAKSITLNVANVGKYLVEDDSALHVDETTGKLSIVWEEI